MASFVSVLKHIGMAPVEVLKWLGSPKGQVVSTEVEQALEIPFPLLTGFFNLFNIGVKKVFTIEALGAATLANTPGSSEIKAAAVVEDLTPLALQFAKENGLPAPTVEQIQDFVNHLVGAGNAFLGPAKASTVYPVPVISKPA